MQPLQLLKRGQLLNGDSHEIDKFSVEKYRAYKNIGHSVGPLVLTLYITTIINGVQQLAAVYVKQLLNAHSWM